MKKSYIIVFLLLFLNCSLLKADDNIDLPKTMVWSTYGLASSSYPEASAFADALMKNYNVRVRLKPSGTCLLYTSPSPRDKRQSRMPSSA